MGDGEDGGREGEGVDAVRLLVSGGIGGWYWWVVQGLECHVCVHAILWCGI